MQKFRPEYGDFWLRQPAKIVVTDIHPVKVGTVKKSIEASMAT